MTSASLPGKLEGVWYQHPQVPWVSYQPVRGGGYQVACSRTRRTGYVPHDRALHQFAAEQARSPAHYGLGDVVHGVAKLLGFEECTDCAEEHAALNRRAPRLWRR